MNTQEFSSGMDVLLNSYAQAASFGKQDSFQTIELNEHEKSVFLTEAQEEFVSSLYNGRNSSLQSFEETEELRRYLSPLIREAKLDPALFSANDRPIGMGGFTNTAFFTLPEDLWFITYESVLITDGKCQDLNTLEVKPIRQDEYHRVKKNPFRGANNRRALRLDLPNNMVEISSKHNITSYYIRYLKKLRPIILASLDTETIRDENQITECEVHESLHRRILELAVRKVLQSRGYTREE